MDFLCYHLRQFDKGITTWKGTRVSAGNSNSSALALRYAAALIEKADETGILDKVEEDIGNLASMIENIEDLRSLTQNPLLDRRRQLQAVMAVSEKAGFNKLSANFLGVLANNRRLDALEDIIKSFHSEMARRRGEIIAEVESAFELTELQENMLRKELGKELGLNVVLNVRVNKEVIGGLRVIVGSKMIDNTVSRKLERLQRMLRKKAEQPLDEVA
jgi:F-type H+-transporting ATPase subunit delta